MFTPHHVRGRRAIGAVHHFTTAVLTATVLVGLTLSGSTSTAMSRIEQRRRRAQTRLDERGAGVVETAIIIGAITVAALGLVAIIAAAVNKYGAQIR